MAKRKSKTARVAVIKSQPRKGSNAAAVRAGHGAAAAKMNPGQGQGQGRG